MRNVVNEQVIEVAAAICDPIQKMASAKFLEEALSTDVDESAVSAIVGSLETQLVTSQSTNNNNSSNNNNSNNNSQQNHLNNSGVSNGSNAAIVKHDSITNGGELHASDDSSTNNNNNNNSKSNNNSGVGASTVDIITTSSVNNSEQVKLLYPTTSTISNSNISSNSTNSGGVFPASLQQTQSQTLPNGNITLAPLTSAATNVQQQTNKHLQQQQTIVIKTSGGNPPGVVGPNLVSVPMSATPQLQHVNTGVCSSAPGTANIQNIMTLAKPLTQTVVTTQNMVPTTPPTGIIPGNVQIVNVRPGVPGPQPQKGVPSRVVLSAPQMVGARPGQPQITLQSLQGLQPGQQGHLLLKTENGQYQLLRVGPAPAPAAAAATAATGPVGIPVSSTPVVAAGAAGTTTYRLQTVPTAVSRLNTQFAGPPLTLRKTIVQQPNSIAPIPASSPAPVQLQQTVSTVTAASTVAPVQSTTTVPVQRQNLDNTKEKCRKFLANLLELSSREPKSVERNVRTLIQELIDCKVEPEEFCDRLERLLNASPQPCLIGFLKKSLPLLRQSLVTKELTIDGIRPPPANVVYSIHNATTSTIQTQVRPQMAGTPVRILAPGTVVRPGQTIVQQRLVTPTAAGATAVTVRAQTPQQQQQLQLQQQHLLQQQQQQQTPRMITATTLRPQVAVTNTTATTLQPPIIVSTSQPPALHPVFPQTQPPVRGAVNAIRPPAQVQIPATAPMTQIKQTAIRTATPIQVKPSGLQTGGAMKVTQASKPSVPSMQPKPTAKEKEKKSFSSASAYTGDDDINDVAAMGGVNLAEETQRILGSTEFVGTQIRSCKDEIFLHLGPLQQKIRQAAIKHGLEEPNSDVAALISHAAQEYIKNIVEKLAVITDHRVEILKNDPRYEVTQDVKGQLKFLEELDRAERKRHEEQEREMLLRAAKSRSKSEDPEQAKLKAKAKEMQRVELEELRQREANATALQAIGPRKKQRLDGDSVAGSTSQVTLGLGASGTSRPQLPLRQRTKKVTLRDLLFLMETEREMCRSRLLYKSYLK